MTKKSKKPKKDWDKELAGKAKVAVAPENDDPEVTEALLLELCPAVFKAEFKKAKTQGSRADFYYEADKHRLEVNREVEEMKTFLSKLGKWFMQELPESDTTGVAGKIARIQIKPDERPSITDWPAFYAFIKKNNAFELLNRAVNAKSVKERWDAGKVIPGVGKFHFKKVSITKVK